MILTRNNHSIRIDDDFLSPKQIEVQVKAANEYLDFLVTDHPYKRKKEETFLKLIEKEKEIIKQARHILGLGEGAATLTDTEMHFVLIPEMLEDENPRYIFKIKSFHFRLPFWLVKDYRKTQQQLLTFS